MPEPNAAMMGGDPPLHHRGVGYRRHYTPQMEYAEAQEVLGPILAAGNTTEGAQRSVDHTAQLARMEQKIDHMFHTMVSTSRPLPASPPERAGNGLLPRSSEPLKAGFSEPMKSGFSDLDEFIGLATTARDKSRKRLGVEVLPTVAVPASHGGFQLGMQSVASDPVVLPTVLPVAGLASSIKGSPGEKTVKGSPGSSPAHSPRPAHSSSGPFSSRNKDHEKKSFLTKTFERFGLENPGMPVEPERTDIFATICHSALFNKVFFLVIVMNIFSSIGIANRYASVDTLGDKGEYAYAVENTFAILFFIELAVKLACHRLYFFINEEWHWNCFDFAVVFVSIADVLALHLGPGQLGPAMRAWRLLRVCKVFRIFRAFKFLSELRIMVACLTSSIVPLMWCTVMIGLIILVVALLFIDLVTQSRIESPDVWADEDLNAFIEADFTSVHGAMLALFESTTGGRDWGELYTQLGKTGILAKIIMLMYVLFFIFAFFNIITSIFVDRVMREATPDHEELMMAKRHDDHKMALELKQLISSLNTDGNTTISSEEFLELNNHPEVAIQFQMAGLNIYDVHSFFKTCCSVVGKNEIEIDTFVEYAFQMKGVASSVDVQTILFEVRDMKKTLRKVKAEARGERSRIMSA